MKFSEFGPAMKTTAAVLSLGAAAFLAACGNHDTVDFVYVTNSKNNPGQINVYLARAQSGQLTQIPDSPYPSGGRNPVGLVTSPNYQNLYVINHDDNTIVQFGIGSDAKLYAQHTYNTPGTFPNAIAINSAGTLLFVTDTYQPQYTAANPGPGALVVYPINADGSLATPVANGTLSYYPLSLGQNNVLNPNALNVLTPAAPAGYTLTGAQTFVYVVSQNSTTGFGDISAFSVASSGALTPLPCSSSTSACDTTGNGGFLAGTAPSAIASTPLGHYLYITDSARNQLLSFGLQSVIPNPQSAPTTIQYTGQLIALQNSPISADAQPDAVTVDPSGNYVYVANYAANDISAYSINPVPANAAPNNAVPLSTGLSPNGTYGTGTGPTCVLVDPALGGYVYTTNFIDNTVSGLNIESKGVLAPVQNTPFAAAGQPTCIAATVYGKVPPITSTN